MSCGSLAKGNDATFSVLKHPLLKDHHSLVYLKIDLSMDNGTTARLDVNSAALIMMNMVWREGVPALAETPSDA
jgi:hypothetical protein